MRGCQFSSTWSSWTNRTRQCPTQPWLPVATTASQETGQRCTADPEEHALLKELQDRSAAPDVVYDALEDSAAAAWAAEDGRPLPDDI